MKPALVIIGLGNVGKEYEGTRHNVGFAAVEKLGEEYGTSEWQPKQKFLAEVQEGRIVTAPILLVKPTTYMNRSGECAKKIIDFFKLDPINQLLVICDDIDLSPGVTRLVQSGGPGSHNGMKSVVDQFGEDVPRLRIGVRGGDAPEGSFQKAGKDLANYVLSKPGKEDSKKIDVAIHGIPGAVKKCVLGK